MEATFRVVLVVEGGEAVEKMRCEQLNEIAELLSFTSFHISKQ